MIASGLAVEGSHGLGHPLHFAHPHMTFGAPPVPEFLRPLPKPAPLVARYNGASAAAAAAAAAARSKYESGPVNLAQQQQQQQQQQSQQSQSQQHKEEDEYLYNSRLFPPPPPPPPPPFSHFPSLPAGPYGTLYPGHYTPLLTRDRPNLPPPPSNPPLSPLEAFPSPHSAPNSPASTYSPPSPAVKSAHPSYRDRKFKVPSGKEGSLKHRILTTTTTPCASTTTTATRPDVLSSSATLSSTSLSSSITLSKYKRRGLFQSGIAPTGTEVLPASFNKGSLIQLANGELKRVEDMRTEDFVTSAERSPALRLDPSTVVRIEPSSSNKSVNLLTLSYGENKSQVEIESAVEHPYFVYGQGWASCSPEKTMAVYGLKCHRLQVGDICISLSPRPSPLGVTTPSTAMTLSSVSTSASNNHHDSSVAVSSSAASLSSTISNSCKKRRWSAPDQYEALTQPLMPTQNSRKMND
ncbi:uncharacterized protein LOC142326756 [Lycorma delicatula]|uniref:uncharacterized protein LOC142326756 n=1 Tax=Lycorma delicatula TaxID=130591 RepID=UPI003F51A606